VAAWGEDPAHKGREMEDEEKELQYRLVVAGFAVPVV